MATESEISSILEFVYDTLSNRGLVAEKDFAALIADFMYGDVATVTAKKNAYKSYLDAKISKIDLALAKLDQDKIDNQAKLEAEKLRRQTEKGKV